MNFNVYVKKSLGEKVAKSARRLHRSRNSIVSEALEEWLTKHSAPSWPKDFFDFEPVTDLPDFKKMRSDFTKNPPEDPLE